MVINYLRATGNGDDTSEEIPDHCFQGDRQTIYMDGVDQAQAVLLNQSNRIPRSQSRTGKFPDILSIRVRLKISLRQPIKEVKLTFVQLPNEAWPR